MRITTHPLMRRTRPAYKSTPEYIAWVNMRDNCSKPKPNSHKYIYDKGIKVHESWSGDRGFANFFACVGKKPEGTILGRLDRSQDYKPGNVRWMSYSEFNKRRPTPFTPRKKGYKLYVTPES